MKIHGIFNPCYTDNEEFVKQVGNTINKLQQDGQEVEIQYRTDMDKGCVLYSALILGRK